jgi:hypothetical protein
VGAEDLLDARQALGQPSCSPAHGRPDRFEHIACPLRGFPRIVDLLGGCLELVVTTRGGRCRYGVFSFRLGCQDPRSPLRQSAPAALNVSGEHIERGAVGQLGERRLGHQLVKAIKQREIPLGDHRLEHPLPGCVVLATQLTGHPRLHRSDHEVGRQRGQLCQEPFTEHLDVPDLAEHSGEPAQLPVEIPDGRRVQQHGELAKRAAQPAGRDSHLVNGVRLVHPHLGVAGKQPPDLRPKVRLQHGAGAKPVLPRPVAVAARQPLGEQDGELGR